MIEECTSRCIQSRTHTYILYTADSSLAPLLYRPICEMHSNWECIVIVSRIVKADGHYSQTLEPVGVAIAVLPAEQRVYSFKLRPQSRSKSDRDHGGDRDGHYSPTLKPVGVVAAIHPVKLRPNFGADDHNLIEF